MKQLKVIDLCCGAGLFSAGMERAGHKVIMGVELNGTFLNSFQANFPDVVALEMDLMELSQVPRCDIIIGGPPCQEFSGINRTGDPSRGLPLVNKFLELCGRSSAKYWIMEEVPQVAAFLPDLESWDGLPRIEIWKCSDFGSKNIRPRMFAGEFPDPVAVKGNRLNAQNTVLGGEYDRTLEEIKDLQGIPSWMEFKGTLEEIKIQIGNGVPLEMGEALGLGILYDHQGRTELKHQSWHTLSAAYYRRRGGNRSYLSAVEWRFCEQCGDYIKVADPSGDPGIPGGAVGGDLAGTPPALRDGTPGSWTGGTPGPGRSGTPSAARQGTPGPGTQGTLEKVI